MYSFAIETVPVQWSKEICTSIVYSRITCFVQTTRTCSGRITSRLLRLPHTISSPCPRQERFDVVYLVNPSRIHGASSHGFDISTELENLQRFSLSTKHGCPPQHLDLAENKLLVSGFTYQRIVYNVEELLLLQIQTHPSSAPQSSKPTCEWPEPICSSASPDRILY